jgi:hypothetical protein
MARQGSQFEELLKVWEVERELGYALIQLDSLTKFQILMTIQCEKQLKTMDSKNAFD